MLKKIFIVLCMLFICNSVFAVTYVKPHVTKDGRIVSGHFRSKPSKTKLDNFSTKDNYNPYTGKKGTSKSYSYKSRTKIK